MKNETLAQNKRGRLTRGLVASLCAAVSIATVGAGCVEEAYDIDRTQPNIIDKDYFNGEWHMRSIIVDKQYENSFPFVGWEGGLERVRFEITENALVANRSYERTPGAEGANAGDNSEIIRFGIQSHFEVQRQYNPVNGAESNVIEENDYDKPWWENSKMRVNWTQLAVNDSSFLARLGWGQMAGMISGMSVAQINHDTNNDPAYPWKVRIVKEDGEEYFETTIDAVVEPNYYACYVMSMEMHCNPSLVKMKMSFKKVQDDNDYEPLDYPDYESVKYGTSTNPLTGATALCFDGDEGCETTELWVADSPGGTVICDPEYHDPDDCQQFTIPIFSKFGYFRTDRYYRDRENGFTITGRERLINRHNIWERSYDSNGDLIPVAERQTKPIVYYMNVRFPPSLHQATYDMAKDWDDAYRQTVADLRGVPFADVDETLYEVRVNDCNIDSVNAYVNNNADIMVGGQPVSLKEELSKAGIESVAYGNLEESCAVLEHWSVMMDKDDEIEDFTWQQLGDLRYNFVTWLPKAEIAGPLGYGPSAADPLTGEIISANANIYGASLDTYANYGADIVQLLNGELTEQDVINGTQVREHIQDVRARWANKNSQETISRFINLHDSRTGHLHDDEYLVPQSISTINSNLDRLADTGFESEYLMTQEMKTLFNPNATSIMPNDVVDNMELQARPSAWGRQAVPLPFQSEESRNASVANLIASGKKLSALELEQRREDYFGRQSFCYFGSQVEPAVADLAAQIADDGLNREEIVQKIRAEIYRGVMAHEVGHTLGLRHNFEGSADAVNFFPQFWGVEVGDHRDSHNTRKSEVAYSSIMDYHQRFNSDFAGIGLYDKAAIKFGYGQLVEVFDETEETFVPRGWINNWSLFYGTDADLFFAGGDFEEQLDEVYDGVIDALYNGNENAFVDLRAINTPRRPENLFKRRTVPFSEFKKIEGRNIFGEPQPDGSPTPVEVPYSYCSDAFAWGGNLSCNRWDKGVTSEEIVNNAGEMYDFYYPFNAFRGDRINNFNFAGAYMGRLYSRTYQPMLNAYRYFYFYRRSTASIWPLIRDWASAAHVGTNFFASVLQTPEPGTYCLEDNAWRKQTAGMACANSFVLNDGAGRSYETEWTDEFQFRYQSIGHVYDKMLAVQAMTTSNAFFARDFSSFLSRGAFNISYYRTFQPEMIKLFGDLMMGQNLEYAARVDTTDGNKPRLIYSPLVEFYDEEYPESAGLYPIEPGSSYILNYYAMLFGMANYTSNSDRTLDFGIRSRITLVGSRNDPEIDPSVLTIEFQDPITQYVYKAAAPDGEELSIGYRMLKDAKDFVESGRYADAATAVSDKEAEIEAAIANGDDVTELNGELATLNTTLESVRGELNNKMQLIDNVRQLSDALEYSN